MKLEKMIESAIRNFDWDDLTAHELSNYRTQDWPAELADEIVKAILITNLRLESPYEERA